MSKIYCGHVLDVLKRMPSKSIDIVVTSPPYWGLRDYGEDTKIIWGGDINCKHEWNSITIKKSTHHGKTSTFNDKRKVEGAQCLGDIVTNQCIKCGAWNGQLGLEPHPQMYIDHIVEIFKEVKRILKDTGSLWLNIGDTYCGHHGAGPDKFERESQNKKWNDGSERYVTRPQKDLKFDDKWLQPKQRLLIPERIAIALQENGWILRNDVIWYKPNHMPESVIDRLTESYEHVFFFTKNREYYFDLDGIREPIKGPTDRIPELINRIVEIAKSVRGKNPYKGKDKSVASIQQGSKPYRDALEVIRKEVKLTKTEEKYLYNWVRDHCGSAKGKNPGDMWSINTRPFKGAHFATFPTTLVERILKCAAPKSGIVLDTFMGSGTTGLIAKQMGLSWIGIELNQAYAIMAMERIGDCKIESYNVNRIDIEKVEYKQEIKKNISKIPICSYEGKCSFKDENGCCLYKRHCKDKGD